MTIRWFRRGQRAIPGAAALVLLAVGQGGAYATVIEIQADGTTAAFNGPVISTGEGTKPVACVPQSAAPVVPAAPGPRLAAVMDAAADRFQISDRLIEAVAWQESRFNERALSRKGAAGVMQLMPATARNLGVDAADAPQNVVGGAHYLSLLLARYDGDLIRALSAYNAGPGAVSQYGGEPPFAETRAFVDAVLARLADMSGQSDPASEVAP